MTLTKPVKAWLEKAGDSLHLSSRAIAWERGELVIETAADGKSLRLPADKVLVTVGRRPRTTGWGLEEMGVDLVDGFIRVNERMQTSMTGVEGSQTNQRPAGCSPARFRRRAVRPRSPLSPVQD